MERERDDREWNVHTDRDEDMDVDDEDDWNRKDGGSLVDIDQKRRAVETRVVECNDSGDDEDIDAAEEDILIWATRKRNSWKSLRLRVPYSCSRLSFLALVEAFAAAMLLPFLTDSS